MTSISPNRRTNCKNEDDKGKVFTKHNVHE